MHKILSMATGLFTSCSIVSCTSGKKKLSNGIKFGFALDMNVKNFDLPKIIQNCEAVKYAGIEFLMQQSNIDELATNAAQRLELKKRFADSPLKCIGLSNTQPINLSHTDKRAMALTDTFSLINLCYNINGNSIGIKLADLDINENPDFIEYAAEFLNTIGNYANEYDRKIRVEICDINNNTIENLKCLFDQIEQPNIGICWNSFKNSKTSLLKENLPLLKDYLDTVHIQISGSDRYYQQSLFNLLVQMNYSGWVIVNDQLQDQNNIITMKEQVSVLNKMIKEAHL